MKKLISILLLIPSIVQANSVTLSWTPPTLNEDGSIIAETCIVDSNTCLAGYRIYISTVSGGPYTLFVDVPGGTTTTTTQPLSAGTYFFVATAYNLGGLESGFSGQATKVIRRPNPPILNTMN